jgi:trans-aconitate methyltransferase
MTTERKDVWASGDAYEPYVKRWSRLVAGEFVAWLGAPPGERWLDVGCGTGALSQVIPERSAPEWVSGIDASKGFVAYARRRVARFISATALALSFLSLQIGPGPIGRCPAAFWALG